MSIFLTPIMLIFVVPEVSLIISNWKVWHDNMHFVTLHFVAL